MDIIIRNATKEDLDRCEEIEIASIKGTHYLRDVWDYFSSTQGELNCALVDGKIVGIGKFTVLPDGSGWLETLRVDPPYQGQGVGKAIYKAYIEQAEKYGCPSMAMYTGLTNVVSAGLAEINGLTRAGHFRGYYIEDFKAPTGPLNFKHISGDRALELIMPKKEDYHGYIVFNRTFYRINEKTIRALAAEGKIYEDADDGSFIALGSRFQHNVALHVAMIGGDYKKCIDFAKRYAIATGVKKITFTIPLENPELEQFLSENGFTKEPADTITKERVFNI